ncbi:unnamed protein product [Orchesella dallaii]|uniref:Major facilitator superfamily (MFS) profile domain-containing protein n=1 Tax=Orchesella dallaii TaxID=48710 RepID=A0ABP1RA18_9HEXA
MYKDSTTVQKRKSSYSPSRMDPDQPSTSSTTTPPQPPPTPFKTSPFQNWGTRHTLTILGFLGFASSYSMRVNLSIAIVTMVNTSHDHGHSHNSSSLACPNLIPNRTEEEIATNLLISSNSKHPKFPWTAHEQGIILGSFFYGYVATQVPGGMLANRIGGKWVFGIGMLITAVFSLVTPWAANTGLEYLVAVRIIQGLGEGVTNPSMHALLAQWVPPLERSMLGAFVYAGSQIGTVVALPVSGWLLGNEDGTILTSGWPSVFYVFGLLGIVWFILWCAFIHDSPGVHPSISQEELHYITSSIGSSSRRTIKPPTPWRKLLTSGPVIAILVAQTGHGWGLYTLLTELPTFMDDVLHFDIKQNAYLSALPYFLMWIVSVVSSIYADKLRARGVGTGFVRKMFNTIAHWIPGILLILASYSACDRSLTVILITLAISINGAAWASFTVNHIDLSPNHAAVMMGITNGFANLCGIGAPYVAGLIINEGSSISRWRLIFFIAAIVYFIDNIVYVCLASGETQSWDSDHRDKVFTSPDRVIVCDPALLEDEEEDDRSPLLVP